MCFFESGTVLCADLKSLRICSELVNSRVLTSMASWRVHQEAYVSIPSTSLLPNLGTPRQHPSAQQGQNWSPPAQSGLGGRSGPFILTAPDAAAFPFPPSIPPPLSLSGIRGWAQISSSLFEHIKSLSLILSKHEKCLKVHPLNNQLSASTTGWALGMQTGQSQDLHAATEDEDRSHQPMYHVV